MKLSFLELKSKKKQKGAGWENIVKTSSSGISISWSSSKKGSNPHTF